MGNAQTGPSSFKLVDSSGVERKVILSNNPDLSLSTVPKTLMASLVALKKIAPGEGLHTSKNSNFSEFLN